MIPRPVRVSRYFLDNGAPDAGQGVLVGFIHDQYKGVCGVVLYGKKYYQVALTNIEDVEGAAFEFVDREFNRG